MSLRRLSRHRDIAQELAALGVHPGGIPILVAKADQLLLLTDLLDPRAQNILKQDCLACGGDAALAESVSRFEPEPTRAVLLLTRRQAGHLARKLAHQPFGLPALGVALTTLLEAAAPRSLGSLTWGAHETMVMGILNVTPDSFSDGGEHLEPQATLSHAWSLVQAGARIIDVGAESTRPGADPVSPAEEWSRLAPLFPRLSDLGIPISVDTRNASTARSALAAGATWVNDIGGLGDPQMRTVVAEAGCPVVLMHMQGEPATMQDAPSYGDVVAEVHAFFQERMQAALEAGIDLTNIILDPGIGFGKRFSDNLTLLRHLEEFTDLGRPLLVGTSRKGFLGTITGTEVTARTNASVAAALMAAQHGAVIVRVHDVHETVEALKVRGAILGGTEAVAG